MTHRFILLMLRRDCRLTVMSALEYRSLHHTPTWLGLVVACKQDLSTTMPILLLVLLLAIEVMRPIKIIAR